MALRTGLLAIALLLLPRIGSAQEAELPLAKGDSVQFSIELDDGMASWTGVIRELINTRECVFVLVRSYDTDMFGIAFDLFESFSLERLAPDPAVFSVTALRNQGIKCVEAHIREYPMYLNPKSDAESEEGA